MRRSRKSKRRLVVSSRRVSFRNHRHAVKPMRGLTSIPVNFRSRRINYAR